MDTIEKALKKQQQHRQFQVTKKVENIVPDSAHEEVVLKHTAKNASSEFSEEQNIEPRISKKIELDLKELENLGFLVSSNCNTVLNEEYRQIKRPLLRNIKGKSAHPIENANIIQVTSSLQGEGKTFTAINLALTFAMEMDFNVLLVDGDTIKSSISRTLINSIEKGLTDYLSGDVAELSDLLLATNVPKLTLLPAGLRHTLSSELLNSEYMDKLIQEFSQRYKNRIVIFDSPPLLQTNDARILSQKVGQIVFVCEQNKTEQNTVKNAISLLDRDQVIGVVMNKSRSAKQDSYYGYYDSSK